MRVSDSMWVPWIVGSSLVLLGCGEEQRSATRGAGPVSAAAAGSAKVQAETANKERDMLVYQDEDFVESPRRRDPFRTYTITSRAAEPDELQRRVVMPSTTVEEMRLIAIVTGTARPKAMLLDPGGVGYVVERGDYLGRPKLVQATGNVSMTINWRVDRIRENEVVLTQQDAADPGRVALTKIIPLHDEVAVR
jgi:Tfp pilus assembly protein PilP